MQNNCYLGGKIIEDNNSKIDIINTIIQGKRAFKTKTTL